MPRAVLDYQGRASAERPRFRMTAGLGAAVVNAVIGAAFLAAAPAGLVGLALPVLVLQVVVGCPLMRRSPPPPVPRWLAWLAALAGPAMTLLAIGRWLLDRSFFEGAFIR